MPRLRAHGFLLLVPVVVLAGCCHPSVTAVPLSPWNMCERDGIPFYLPKPLLVISKNFRYIEDATVGLTNSAPIPGYFDDQARYGDVNARKQSSADPGTVAAQPTPAQVLPGVPAGFGTPTGPVLHS